MLSEGLLGQNSFYSDTNMLFYMSLVLTTEEFSRSSMDCAIIMHHMQADVRVPTSLH